MSKMVTACLSVDNLVAEVCNTEPTSVPSHKLAELLAGDINHKWRVQCHNKHNTADSLYINKYNITVQLDYVVLWEELQWW